GRPVDADAEVHDTAGVGDGAGHRRVVGQAVRGAGAGVAGQAQRDLWRRAVGGGAREGAGAFTAVAGGVGGDDAEEVGAGGHGHACEGETAVGTGAAGQGQRQRGRTAVHLHVGIRLGLAGDGDVVGAGAGLGGGPGGDRRRRQVHGKGEGG